MALVHGHIKRHSLFKLRCKSITMMVQILGLWLALEVARKIVKKHRVKNFIKATNNLLATGARLSMMDPHSSEPITDEHVLSLVLVYRSLTVSLLLS